jgi:hypothetical protein
MKNLLVLLAFCLLISTACEKIDKNVFFKLGSGQEFTFSDIELYDTSTNILYFRKDQDYLEKMYQNSFAFMNQGEIIYQGSFHPGYSSSMPIGPFIWSPPAYGTYALKIDNWTNSNNPVVRKDPAIINILNQNNLLHSGLQISGSSINIQGTQLTFKFTITNKDQTDLMIIDPNKTGLNLFHYFTNGLYIYDSSNNEVFTSSIQHQSPDPWNSWKIEWLSELKSGKSTEFTIVYSIDNPLASGEYETKFKFPGLGVGGQISKDQLYQGNSRIWLGEISTMRRVTIP